MNQLTYRVVVGLWVAATLVFAQATLAQTEADVLKRHVVAIYDEDGRLLGSGASVSATGLILTAKHILEQRVAGSTPSYRMSVQVRAQRDTERRAARLVATHPHMDIAILDAPEGALIPPLLVSAPENLNKGNWYAIGHPIGRTNERLNPTLFFTMSGAWSQVEQRGGLYVMPGPPFDTGMSGGPVILDDRIVGVVSFAAQKGHVAPISVALDYFSLLGFSTSDSGLFERSDHVGRLAAKIDTYEKILMDIQADRRWVCALDATWPENAAGGMPQTLGLTLRSERKLPSQPDINAQLRMSVSAKVATAGQPPTEFIGLDGGTTYITASNPVAGFTTIGQALDYAIGQNVDRSTAQLGALDFLIAVSGISGDFIRTSGMPGYAICCTFNFSDRAPAATATARWEKDAERCTGNPVRTSEVTGDDQ